MTNIKITFDFTAFDYEGELSLSLTVTDMNAQVLLDPDAQPYEYAFKELNNMLHAYAVLISNDKHAEVSRICEVREV